MSDIETMRIGDEHRLLAVIDDFAADPDGLRAAAADRVFESGRHAYPGLRADLPGGYWQQQAGSVRQAAAAIGLAAATMTVIDATFSIVTTPRAALSVSQRLPHCDSHEPGRVAFVHYLDRSEQSGGTAFFRHRSTRFETIDRHRAPIYAGQLDAELHYGGPPPADYVGKEDRLFERIATVPVRYNRAVLYRSFALHSGVIPPAASLAADPLTGRLTVTGFLAFD